jgi:copper chaperone CopZ
MSDKIWPSGAAFSNRWISLLHAVQFENKLNLDPKNQRAMAQTKTAIISIENLKDGDLSALRQVLQGVPGVETVDFSVERNVAVIDFDPSQSHIDDFLRAILKAGFKVL